MPRLEGRPDLWIKQISEWIIKCVTLLTYTMLVAN